MKTDTIESYLKRKKKTTILLLLLGLVIYMLFLLVIQVDVIEVFRIIHRVDSKALILALVFDTLFIIFYALAWFSLVRIVSNNIRIKDALLAVIMGWLGDMIVPAAFMTGEVIRLYYVNKKCNIEYGRLVPTVILHRLLSAMAFVFYIVLGAVLIARYGAIPTDVYGQTLAVAVICGIFALIGFIVLFNERIMSFLLDRTSNTIKKFLAKFKLEHYIASVEGGLNSFKYTIHLLYKKRLPITLGFILLLIQWMFGILIPYMVFKALYYPISFWILSLAYPLYGVIDNIPLGIPVNAGLLDTAMITTFVLLGIDKEASVSATMLTRAITVAYEALLTGTISLAFGIRSLIGSSRNKW
ncbi:MAG: hypothetical protein DRN53_08110 [Thermoprotei archaeon]|nr:MAG: hypothetical protein DRN53_08110 [Thermoprotei archaeon]